jgi:hypothetical protein
VNTGQERESDGSIFVLPKADEIITERKLRDS